MDVMLEFSVALADGATPRHKFAPALRRILPDTQPIPLAAAGTALRAQTTVGPLGASFVLALSGRDYFDVEVSFAVLVAGTIATPLAFSELIRRVTTRRERGRLVIALEVMAPQLREVSGPGASFSTEQTVSRIADEPLGAFPRPPPVGPTHGVAPKQDPNGDSFLDNVRQPVERSRLRFFEHRMGHPLIATYAPRRAIPTAGDYLFYFKPPKHNAATPKQVVESYLTLDGGTCILGALEHSGTTAVLCFLIGEAGSPSATLITASGIATTVREIDARLRAGNPFLVGSGVRSVALAGFSQGGEYLAKVMHKVTTSPLDGLLKAVFVFDCFFPAGQEAFKTQLRTWFNAGSDRVVRSYWGHTVHPCDLYADQPAFRGDDGTESRTVPYGHPAGVPDYSWLHFTDAFLRHRCLSLVNAGHDLHHCIPRLFLTHALRLAGMARLIP